MAMGGSCQAPDFFKAGLKVTLSPRIVRAESDTHRAVQPIDRCQNISLNGRGCGGRRVCDQRQAWMLAARLRGHIRSGR
jgi:hypothetical protein